LETLVIALPRPWRLLPRPARLIILGLALLLGGCSGSPSALAPGGVRAAQIAALWWLLLGLAAAACLGILLLVLAVASQSQPFPPTLPPRRAPAGRLGQAARLAGVVGGGILLPLGVLAGVQAVAVQTLAAQTALPPAPLTVQVRGHQYWWEVRYPQAGVTSANELHVPVATPVRLELSSADVLHSFWVPELVGKTDLVPGQVNVTWLRVEQAGRYRGQCAEYCGLQHAHMALLVVAEPPQGFAAWLQQQRLPASPPSDPLLQQGAQAFARFGCLGCHAIRYGDSPVGGSSGPDLTHVGSRQTLAAGLLPNSYGNMAGWIGNPQALKPGNDMPVLNLDPDSLRAVAAYLESLK
jgi:cytochrome c oxidase subunit 2